MRAGMIRRLFTPGASLRERVVFASFWSAALRGSTRGIGFARNVILARLLAPDDFGLFGIALLVLSILERFSESGLHAALVQKKDDIRDYLDTAWTVLLLRGLGLAFLLYVTAPYVARFFDEPSAVPLIQFLGFTVFLRGVRSPGILYFRRDLEFQRSFVLRVAETTVELIVSIIAAVILKNAWALMLGLVASNLTMAVLSFALHPYRPRLRLDWDQVRELRRFGRWIYFGHVLQFLSLKGDKVIIGRLLGAPALGVYMLAFSIAEVLTLEISRVATSVGFPAYSRIQEERKRVLKWYKTATTLVFSIALPVAVVIALLAEPLTLLVLGERWIEVSYVLPALAFAGVLRAVKANMGAILKGIGHPEVVFHASLLSVAGMYLSIFPLVTFFGLRGAGLAMLISSAVGLPLAFYRVSRLLEIDRPAAAAMFVPGLILSLAVGLPVLMAMSFVGPLPLARFAAGAVVATVAYLVVAGLMWRAGLTGPFSLVTLIRNRKARSGPELTPATR